MWWLRLRGAESSVCVAASLQCGCGGVDCVAGTAYVHAGVVGEWGAVVVKVIRVILQRTRLYIGTSAAAERGMVTWIMRLHMRGTRDFLR